MKEPRRPLKEYSDMDLHPRLGQDTPIRQLSDDCLTHFRTALAAIGPDLIEYTPSRSARA